MYSRIESVDLVTDSDGKYLFTKKIENIDSYDAFSVSVEEEYLKNCGSFQDKDITEQYLYIDGFDNEANIEACSVSVVKITANKIDGSSGNILTIQRSWPSGSFTFTKIIEVISNDKEIKLYYSSTTPIVDLQFITSNSSETKQVNLVPNATIEISVDF